MERERDEETADRHVERGSADPGPGDDVPAARDLDTERLEEGGGVPALDALDLGERGAPTASLGTGAGGTGTGPPYEGRAGSGAKVAGQRARAQDLAEGEDSAAGRGPAAGLPEVGGRQGSREESS